MDERELNPETNLSAEELGRAWFEDQELFHHGVKGQKHGRRRYQNPDGSLTALGRIHYGVGNAGKKVAGGVGKAAKKVAGGVKKAVAKKAEQNRIKKLMKKPIRKLTAEELAERTERTRKEEELHAASKRARDAEAAAKGFLKKLGSTMLDKAVIPALADAGKKSLEKFFGEGIDKALGVGAENSYKILKKAGFDYDKLTDAQSKALLAKTTADKKSAENLEFLKSLKGDKKTEKTGGDDDSNSGGNKTNRDDDGVYRDKSSKSTSQGGAGSNAAKSMLKGLSKNKQSKDFEEPKVSDYKPLKREKETSETTVVTNKKSGSSEANSRITEAHEQWRKQVSGRMNDTSDTLQSVRRDMSKANVPVMKAFSAAKNNKTSVTNLSTAKNDDFNRWLNPISEVKIIDIPFEDISNLR